MPRTGMLERLFMHWYRRQMACWRLLHGVRAGSPWTPPRAPAANPPRRRNQYSVEADSDGSAR